MTGRRRSKSGFSRLKQIVLTLWVGLVVLLGGTALEPQIAGAAVTLGTADLTVVGYNSDGSSDDAALLALADIPAGTTVFITDNGWNTATGTFTTGSESIITWTTPLISAGTIVNANSLPGTSTGSFTSLSTLGDQILIFQTVDDTPGGTPTIIYAFNNQTSVSDTIGKWQTTIMSQFTESTLPAGTTEVTTSGGSGNAFGLLGEVDNLVYTGPTTAADKTTWLSLIHTTTNWTTSNTTPQDIAPGGSNLPTSVTVEPLLDFGDAPGSYPTLLANDGARHILGTGPFLGASVDSEPDGQPTVTADGDDLDLDGDDEDGVVFTSDLVTGQTASVTATASGTGLINAWIDFNSDGDWHDAGEQIFIDTALVVGPNPLTFTVPAGASLGNTYARFRFDTGGGLASTGLAANGEVEDYQVPIGSPMFMAVKSVNKATAVPGDTLSYTVTLTNNGSVSATDVGFVDTIEPNLSLVVGSVTTTKGTITQGNTAGDTVVAVDIGSIFTAETVTMTFQATVNDPVPAGVNEVCNNSDVFGSNFTPTATNKICTSILVPKGTITILKEATPEDGTDFSFSSDISGGNSFTLDDEPSPTDAIDQSITFNDIPTGTYNITETVPAGWQLESATCINGSDSGSLDETVLSVSLGADESITCTFINTKLALYLSTGWNGRIRNSKKYGKDYGARKYGKVNGLPFADEDILAFDLNTKTWSLFFDGSDVGLKWADINAFHLLDDGNLLLSSDRHLFIPGLGKVDDSDIIKFVPASLGKDTAGSFEMYFDGSDVGLTRSAEDIDAIAFTPEGDLVVSTTGNFQVPGINGKGEDLIVFDDTSLGATTSGTWAPYFDGSDVDLRKGYENVNGAWIDAANGGIYLTTKGKFKVSDMKGDGTDVFLCEPDSLGANTNCSYEPFWDGSDNGVKYNVVDALTFGPAPAASEVE